MLYNIYNKPSWPRRAMKRLPVRIQTSDKRYREMFNFSFFNLCPTNISLLFLLIIL